MQESVLVTLSKEELLNEVGKIIDSRLSKLDLSPVKRDTDLISQKEAAAFLKVSEATLIKFKKEGKLTYNRIGKRYYYSKEDLMKNMYRVQGGQR